MSTREVFQNIVDELGVAIAANESKRAEVRKQMANLVNQALATNDGDVKKYAAAESSVNFFGAILTELHVRLISARLALWHFDLETAKETTVILAAKTKKAREDMHAATEDKAVYLRGSGGRSTIDATTEHLSSLEIICVDYRARLEVAERNGRIALKELDALKAGFNKVADELNVPGEKFEESYGTPGTFIVR